MERLRLLLILNQNNLDKLRARARFCVAKLAETESDTHKQFGPYASYWDEWFEQAESIAEDLRSDVAATAHFATELREFIVAAEHEPPTSKAHQKRVSTMHTLALEALECQKDMLSITDQRLAEHREFTHKLLLVEAIDSLNEE